MNIERATSVPHNSRMDVCVHSQPYSTLAFPLTQTPTYTRVPTSFYASIFSFGTWNAPQHEKNLQEV